MVERPRTTEEFVEWARTTLDHTYDDKTRTWYDAASANLLTTVDRAEFSGALPESLASARNDYWKHFRSELFAAGDVPTVRWLVKSFDSCTDKLFRTNVVWNAKWPAEPKNGWVAPTDVLAVFDDVVRGRLVCKYMDGPEFLASRIKKLAESHNVACDYESRQLDEGYYAYHVYLRLQVDSFDQAFNPRRVTSKLELQITTQLQDVMKELTHRFYKQRRLQLCPDRRAWKWEHKSNQFRSAYLAHTLHMLEGMILDVRDAAGEDDDE